jgi:hypothetical protein
MPAGLTKFEGDLLALCACAAAAQSIRRGYQGARPLTRTQVISLTQRMNRKSVMAAELHAKTSGRFWHAVRNFSQAAILACAFRLAEMRCSEPLPCKASYPPTDRGFLRSAPAHIVSLRKNANTPGHHCPSLSEGTGRLLMTVQHPRCLKPSRGAVILDYSFEEKRSCNPLPLDFRLQSRQRIRTDLFLPLLNRSPRTMRP